MKRTIRNGFQSLRCRFAGLMLALFTTTAAQAITNTWDCGAGNQLWTNKLNWSADVAPAANDVVIIDGAVTVNIAGLSNGFLPSGAKVVLTNGATLYNSADVCRMNGSSTVSVAANCDISDYWAMYQGSMSFQNGAKWTTGDLELGGPNVFSFKLGSSGFTKLTPSTLRWDASKKFTQQTWTVDMADYTGGPASILLVDCSSTSDANMTASNFWYTATRTVTNPGIYTNSTVIFDTVQQAFVLKVSETPINPPTADLVWDGGGGSVLWATAANWDPDFVPVAGVTVEIAIPVTVEHGGNFPACTISLKNGAGLKGSGGALRINGATINVASNSLLSGGWWDMNSGNINFQNGAGATMTDWEQKGVNRFNFKLGPAGFTTLLPGRLWGTSPITSTISNATYIADMANYTGSNGIITLVDFSADSYGMTSDLFQNAKLSVTNTDGYVGNLQWNNTAKSIELNVTGLPVYYWDNDGTTAGFGTAAGTWAAPTTGDGTQGWSRDTAGATLPASMSTSVRSTVNFGYGAIGLASGTITVSGTVANGNMTFASGSGAITLSGGTITLAPAATITVNNSSDTISSVLAGTGSSLTKAGSGTLTLSGTNTYSGTTTIHAGTLAVGGNNVLTNLSPVSMGSATLDAGTYSNQAGTLDVAGSAVIKLGTGATLAFADSSAIDWAGGTLTLTGRFISGSSLRFGTNANGLTADQLAKISAAGYYKFTLDASGYLKAQTGTLIMFQ